MQAFSIITHKKEEMVNITKEVQDMISIDTGICYIFLRHATAGVFINENEEGLKEDFLNMFGGLINDRDWKHNKIDNNASAHMKASLVGQSVFVPVKDRKLQLGRWQSIFLIEFDGPRQRELIIEVR